jgi:hypothetical protein
VETKRDKLAAHYKALGHDPERLVTTMCWMEGCAERVEVPFIDASIGRIYCPAHSVVRVPKA